ncbi:TIR domain-containing protein [Actinocrispum sp. NPDC049592]|uniref:TIR domain-containing protein n=1 Tax=Actinocrispum sp. NPDC049592 TaxID=3154835 RepID=UPI003438C3CC
MFLSFSGTDRTQVRNLAFELRALGLRVFVDEDDIAHFVSITKSIRDGLSSSKCLVAYYSADYAVRPACQRELMIAFLAGQREGDPCKRILVINPESSTLHLRPIELADARFALPVTGVIELARQVAKRTEEIQGSIGEVPHVPNPWLSVKQSSHVLNLIGRHAELWDLHSALNAIDYPLIRSAICGPFVSVNGLPGAGKTALVTAYSSWFSDAYPGGIHWLSLAGAGATLEQLKVRYIYELHRVAFKIGFDVDAIPGHRIIKSIADHLQASGAPSLWIIDDVPEMTDLDILDILTMPAYTGARTILIGDKDTFRDIIPSIRIGPMPLSDASSLLDRYRLPDNAKDRRARDSLALRLNTNAAALIAVGDYLRDRQGQASYASAMEEIDQESHFTKYVLARISRVLDQMGTSELSVLCLVDQLGANTIPAQLLTRLPGLDNIDVGAVLKSLSAYSAASRVGSIWTIDPLIVLATRIHYTTGDMTETFLQEVIAIITEFLHSAKLTAHEIEVSRMIINDLQLKLDNRILEAVDTSY